MSHMVSGLATLFSSADRLIQIFRIHRDVRFSKNPLPYKVRGMAPSAPVQSGGEDALCYCDAS